jgi:hypothetical protein
MKLNNEFGFSIKNRKYFLLKAVFYYDFLLELEVEGFVLIKRKDADGNLITVIEMINEIAIKIVLASDVSDAEFIVDNLANWPASESELKTLLSGPLSSYLSFQV